MIRTNIAEAKRLLEEGHQIWVYDQDMGINILWGDFKGDSQWVRVVEIRGPLTDPMDPEFTHLPDDFLGGNPDEVWELELNRKWTKEEIDYAANDDYRKEKPTYQSPISLAVNMAKKILDERKNVKVGYDQLFLALLKKYEAKQTEADKKRLAEIRSRYESKTTRTLYINTEVGWQVMGGGIFCGPLNDSDEPPGPTVFRKRDDFPPLI